MPTHAAFLRGINVGGNKKVPMATLKTCLEKIGLKNVKTLLASGNVVFDAEKKDAAAIKSMIEKQMESTFGFTVGTIVRPMKDIKALIASAPFKGIKVTPEMRLYITFLPGKPTSKLKIPYESPEKNFRILRVTDGEVISVLTVTPEMRSVDAMAILEKEYGKNVTTRNWNTVEKVAKLG